MSATVDTSIDWQAEVLRLKFGPRQMSAAEIAEEVGKHAATVRKVVARATEADIERVVADAHQPQGDIERAVEKPEDPLHAFKAEAGEAVGDMPKQPEPEMVEQETRVRGTHQTCIDFGPDADLPTGGTLVLKSEKLASGHFRPGDLIRGSFVARVVGTAHKEKLDKASEEFRAKPTAYEALMTEIDWKIS